MNGEASLLEVLEVHHTLPHINILTVEEEEPISLLLKSNSNSKRKKKIPKTRRMIQGQQAINLEILNPEMKRSNPEVLRAKTLSMLHLHLKHRDSRQITFRDLNQPISRKREKMKASTRYKTSRFKTRMKIQIKIHRDNSELQFWRKSS